MGSTRLARSAGNHTATSVRVKPKAAARPHTTPARALAPDGQTPRRQSGSAAESGETGPLQRIRKSRPRLGSG
jgi:hypothetical protein